MLLMVEMNNDVEHTNDYPEKRFYCSLHGNSYFD
jgi:hypothetical protein